jgi:hypothetical protein
MWGKVSVGMAIIMWEENMHHRDHGEKREILDFFP